MTVRPGNTQGGASNLAIHIENGERVFPCRCGEKHRGPYAVYDFAHHNCFHELPLGKLHPEAPNYLICPLCGKTFRVAA